MAEQDYEPGDDVDRAAKRARWREEDPPENQKWKRRGAPTGIWARFLIYAQRNPRRWWRSHPLQTKHHAQQMCSEIRHKTALTQNVRDKLDQEGYFETDWGYGQDDNHLDHWYVFVRWIPEKKDRSNGEDKSKTNKRNKQSSSRVSEAVPRRRNSRQ